MDLLVTLGALGAGALLLAVSAWQSGRKRPDSLRPRWTPWRFLVLLAGAIILLAGAHLLSLAGMRPDAQGY
jgi:hypothetical protein